MGKDNMIEREAGSKHSNIYKDIQRAMGYTTFYYKEAQIVGKLADQVLEGKLSIEGAAKRGRTLIHKLNWGT